MFFTCENQIIMQIKILSYISYSTFYIFHLKYYISFDIGFPVFLFRVISFIYMCVRVDNDFNKYQCNVLNYLNIMYIGFTGINFTIMFLKMLIKLSMKRYILLLYLFFVHDLIFIRFYDFIRNLHYKHFYLPKWNF